MHPFTTGVGTSRVNNSTPERGTNSNQAANEEEPVSRSARMMRLWNEATHRSSTTTTGNSNGTSGSGSGSGGGYNLFGGSSTPAATPAPASTASNTASAGSSSTQSTTSRFSSFFGLGSKDSAADSNATTHSTGTVGGYSGGLVSSTNTKATDESAGKGNEEDESKDKGGDGEKEEEEGEKGEVKDVKPPAATPYLSPVSHLHGFPHLKGNAGQDSPVSPVPANNESNEPMTGDISKVSDCCISYLIS